MTICSRSVRRTMSIGSTKLGQVGRFSTSSLTAGLELHLSDHSDLEAEVAQGAAQSFSMAMVFDCSSLRWVSIIRSFWLRSVFTCTGR